MENYSDFREWLDENTKYTNQTKGNIVSRLKRADAIMRVNENPVYLFNLSNKPEFMDLSVSVKSQVRRAVKLYFEYKGVKNVKKNG